MNNKARCPTLRPNGPLCWLSLRQLVPALLCLPTVRMIWAGDIHSYPYSKLRKYCLSRVWRDELPVAALFAYAAWGVMSSLPQKDANFIAAQSSWQAKGSTRWRRVQQRPWSQIRNAWNEMPWAKTAWAKIANISLPSLSPPSQNCYHLSPLSLPAELIFLPRSPLRFI